MTDQIPPPTGDAREAARTRARNFRDSERMHRERAEAETLPRLKDKLLEAATAYARLAASEERLANSTRRQPADPAPGNEPTAPEAAVPRT